MLLNEIIIVQVNYNKNTLCDRPPPAARPFLPHKMYRILKFVMDSLGLMPPV
jgi:hypothetical protein